ncbi:MAG: AarF/ABC1/UbiB kinase family protein [Pseudomonadota bacterium]
MADDDQSNRELAVPSGRMSRFLRMGSLATGIAGNVALNGARELARGQRPDLRDLMITPRNIQRITDQLAQMRGAAMKMGQLMSMDGGDVLPPELTEIMGKLRNDAHFMPPKQLREVLNAHWGKDWLPKFEKFNVRPIAAASIGQVHHARLKDGRDMAIKVQYPGVARSIDADVANVGTLMRLSGLMPQGFDPAPYLHAARVQLHEETDYAREGHYLRRFADRLAGSPDFVVPAYYEDWSSDAVLAMEFIAGQSIETLAEADQATRDRAMTLLLRLTFQELFDWHEMQTDPNFANYLYDPDTAKIVLLDFGATRVIDPALAEHYRRLMAAGLTGDRDGLWDASLAMGLVTDDMPADHTARIRAMMDLGAETFAAADVYDFADRGLSQAMQREGEALVADGFVPPPVPMDILYIQRKFGGLFLLATRLKAKIAIKELFAPYLNARRAAAE